jgi:hypothetical protein
MKKFYIIESAKNTTFHKVGDWALTAGVYLNISPQKIVNKINLVNENLIKINPGLYIPGLNHPLPAYDPIIICYLNLEEAFFYVNPQGRHVSLLNAVKLLLDKHNIPIEGLIDFADWDRLRLGERSSLDPTWEPTICNSPAIIEDLKLLGFDALLQFIEDKVQTTEKESKNDGI